MGKVFGIFALLLGVVGLAVSAAVGIISLIELRSAYVWIIIPFIAIILGIIGIVKDDSKGKAIGGFIFGILGIILGFVFNNFIAVLLSL
ncbi:hypothetical protein LCGC14_0672760 [marine sediment metagenome]|uniref:Uncharacterized protein n=1 Tax=marine sediment metagenome TaxID=412755 RepID=A0A0F9RAT7_9ZZZZ